MAFDQEGFARRVSWCYVAYQNKVGDFVTLADYGRAVAETEGRYDKEGELRAYSASSVQAWMVPGGSIPEPGAVQAIAELAEADPGWVYYGDETGAPPPQNFPFALAMPQRRRRQRT